MQAVLEARRALLGKEHPYTLYAVLNTARLMSASGAPRDAEALLAPIIPIAGRNLDPNHFGTLIGLAHLSGILVKQGRYQDAEDVYIDVIRRHRYESAAKADGELPRRILTMSALVTCFQAHGKYEDTLKVWRDVMDALSAIGGSDLGLKHPFTSHVREKGKGLVRLLQKQKVKKAKDEEEGNRDTEIKEEEKKMKVEDEDEEKAEATSGAKE